MTLGITEPLPCAGLAPHVFPVTIQPTCPEPNDSEESEESEDEGMDEGANFNVPAEVVLRLIASGSHSGSTATLEDMLRVEYDRDADANLMVDIDLVDFSLQQCFKLLNEGILPFQPLHLNREMKGLHRISSVRSTKRRCNSCNGRERDHGFQYTVISRVTKPTDLGIIKRFPSTCTRLMESEKGK